MATTDSNVQNAIGLSGLNGAVQKYLKRSWQTMKERSYDTPLANSNLGTKATIPKNEGQYVEFRFWEKFGLPLEVDQDEEPSDNADYEKLQSSTLQVPLRELAGAADLGNLLKATDMVDLMQQVRDKLKESVRRGVHRKVNEVLACGFSDADWQGTGDSYSASNLPYAYAGGVDSYGNLTADSYIGTQDVLRVVGALRNSGVPTPFSNAYAFVMDTPMFMTLIYADSELRDLFKTAQGVSQANKAFEQGVPQGDQGFQYLGCRWIIQDDAYRVALGNDPTNAANRLDSGAVHVGHILGQEAFGYVDLAGSASRARLNPTFKVQDITTTGHRTTVGYRIPFKATTLNTNFGVNLATTARYDETVDQL